MAGFNQSQEVKSNSFLSVHLETKLLKKDISKCLFQMNTGLLNFISIKETEKNKYSFHANIRQQNSF